MDIASRSLFGGTLCLCTAFAMGSLTACTGTPSTGEDEAGGALSAADLGRGVASAMADQQVRVAVRDAMASSPLARHRIGLQRFLGSAAGRPMLARLAGALGTSADELQAVLARMQPLELYLPKRADRVSWSGSDHLAVAAAVKLGEAPEVAFTPAGGTAPVAELRTSTGGAAPAAFVVRPVRAQMLRTQPSSEPSRTTVQDPAESGVAMSSVTSPAGDSTGVVSSSLEACGPGTEVICDDGGGGGGAPPRSTYLGVLWVLHSDDNGSYDDALELRFESYWTRISDGARIDHTTLAYDAPNDFVGAINGVLSPHVFDGFSGYYLHTEIWENDGWWGDDHYGDADLTSTSMYSPQGSAAPFFIAGDYRCGYYNPGLGNFLCPPDGGLYWWKELNFNVWHN